MIGINELKFDENGLIPAIVTDHESGAVLMLAYMNKESIGISIKEGKTCFWSRSRKELWRKGETSGNTQHIVNIKTDCDKDSLVVIVRKSGPACHTGAESCFFENIYDAGDETAGAGGSTPGIIEEKSFSMDALHNIIKDRKINRKPGSYTTYLFEKGIDKILKKLGEESTEVIIAAKAGKRDEAVYELADLTYHVMVLMTELGISPDDITKELALRYNKGEEE